MEFWLQRTKKEMTRQAAYILRTAKKNWWMFYCKDTFFHRNNTQCQVLKLLRFFSSLILYLYFQVSRFYALFPIWSSCNTSTSSYIYYLDVYLPLMSFIPTTWCLVVLNPRTTHFNNSIYTLWLYMAPLQPVNLQKYTNKITILWIKVRY